MVLLFLDLFSQLRKILVNDRSVKFDLVTHFSKVRLFFLSFDHFLVPELADSLKGKLFRNMILF